MLGEKVIIRCVSFKPYCSEEDKGLPGRSTRESPFEELSSWLLHQLPVIAQHTGVTNSEKVQAFLDDKPDKFWEVAAKIYAFIKAEKV